MDDLNKQKESVAAHLAQISQLLGTQMPGLSDALKPAPAVPAVASSPARAVTAAPAPAPVPSSAPQAPRQSTSSTPKQAAGNKPAKAADGDGEDWWTE